MALNKHKTILQRANLIYHFIKSSSLLVHRRPQHSEIQLITGKKQQTNLIQGRQLTTEVTELIVERQTLTLYPLLQSKYNT